MFKVPNRGVMKGIILVNIEESYEVNCNSVYIFVGNRIRMDNVQMTPSTSTFLTACQLGNYSSVLPRCDFEWLGGLTLPENHMVEDKVYLQLHNKELYMHYLKESWWATVEGWVLVERTINYECSDDVVSIKYGDETMFECTSNVTESVEVDLDNSQMVSVYKGVECNLQDAVMHTLVKYGYTNLRGRSTISLNSSDDGYSNDEQVFVILRDGEFYRFIGGADKICVLRRLRSDEIGGEWMADYGLDDIIPIQDFIELKTIGGVK